MSSTGLAPSFPAFPGLPLPDPDPNRRNPLPTAGIGSIPPETRRFFDAVQGNILKGHGRDHQRLIFFRFAGNEGQSRQLLSDAVNPPDGSTPWVTTASAQTTQTENWIQARPFIELFEREELFGEVRFTDEERKKAKKIILKATTQVIGGLMLSKAGLAKLGFIDGEGRVPPFSDFSYNWPEPFSRGLKVGLEGDKFAQRKADLTKDWSAPFTEDFDGVFLLACADKKTLDDKLDKEFIPWLEHASHRGEKVTDGRQECTTWRTSAAAGERGRPREAFGFADGISVTRFFDTERDDVRPGDPEPWEWIDLAMEDVFIGEDQSQAFAGGSFVALLKFEQDVARFRAYEDSMVEAMMEQATIDETHARVLAEPLLAGRNRAGDPLKTVLFNLPGAPEVVRKLFGLELNVPFGGAFPPELNIFDFKNDGAGKGCPFHAHIRKMNPRVDQVRSFDKKGIIGAQLVRRGMAYDPAGLLPAAEAAIANHQAPVWPSTGVGLMFMAFMRDLSGQFELLHNSWAWDTSFPSSGAGQSDPLLFGGLGGKWKFGRVTFDPVPAVVKRLGGTYLFAPSILWLARGGRRP